MIPWRRLLTFVLLVPSAVLALGDGARASVARQDLALARQSAVVVERQLNELARTSAARTFATQISLSLARNRAASPAEGSLHVGLDFLFEPEWSPQELARAVAKSIRTQLQLSTTRYPSIGPLAEADFIFATQSFRTVAIRLAEIIESKPFVALLSSLWDAIRDGSAQPMGVGSWLTRTIGTVISVGLLLVGVVQAGVCIVTTGGACLVPLALTAVGVIGVAATELRNRLEELPDELIDELDDRGLRQPVECVVTRVTHNPPQIFLLCII